MKKQQQQAQAKSLITSIAVEFDTINTQLEKKNVQVKKLKSSNDYLHNRNRMLRLERKNLRTALSEQYEALISYVTELEKKNIELHRKLLKK